MRNNELTFQEIKAKATELYIKDKGKPPPDEMLTLKTTPSIHSSYWKKAREILLGEVEEKDVMTIPHIAEREYVRPKEAAKALGVSPKTLRRYWKKGKIKAVRLPSGRLRYPKDEIERIRQTK